MNLTNLKYTEENLKLLCEFDQYDDLLSENKSVDSNNNFDQPSITKFYSDSDSKAKSIN